MLKTISEAKDKKITLDCLHIKPPKPGRKEDRNVRFFRFHEVRNLIQDGMTAAEAYKVVAEKHFKSQDTIRREYERMLKKSFKRKLDGEND